MTGQDALLSAWRSVVAHFPGGYWDEQHGAAVGVTTLPWEANNPAWIVREDDAVAAVEWAIERRGGYGVGFDLPSGRHLLAERELSAIGHRVILSRPMMVASVSDIEVRPAAGLELSRAITSSDADEVASVQSLAFASPVEMERAQLPDAQLRDPSSFVAIGRVDGQPVSAAVAIRSEHGVAIFGVATDPAHQGRGYGSATTAYAIRSAGTEGQLVALQATTSGYPVYRSMGFVDAGPWDVWSADRDLRA